MKRRTIAALILLIVCSLSLTAAPFSAPAATVRLIRTVPISTAELNAEVREYQEGIRLAGGDPTTVDHLQVLNLLINNELFRQGAERDGVKITKQMVDSAFAQQKSAIESSIGARLSDAEFAQVIEQNFGGSVTEYRGMLEEQLLVDAYLMQKKGEELSESISVSESEINSFYRKNRTHFVSPETVKLSHIYIPYSENVSTDRQNKALLDGVAADIQSGRLSFERAVVLYSEDAKSKSIAGDIGWLTMDNQEALAGLGDDFFDVAFSTDVGTISNVVSSYTGYHILKVLAYNEMKLMTLEDPLGPGIDATLRDYIVEELSAAKYQEAYVNAINSLVAELRSRATVNILYK